MANSNLKFLLGLYPKTEQIEQKRNELLKEFDELTQYAKSDELARYNHLDKFVNVIHPGRLPIRRHSHYLILAFIDLETQEGCERRIQQAG